jgi:hypothetical protein
MYLLNATRTIVKILFHTIMLKKVDFLVSSVMEITKLLAVNAKLRNLLDCFQVLQEHAMIVFILNMIVTIVSNVKR